MERVRINSNSFLFILYGKEYFYDEAGVISFKYNGALYLYKKDIQGNIIAILDSNGNTVVNYYYDAWGNHTISGNLTIGNENPFRYRGYFYDKETQLYYLQTRYYDPEVGRFISPDNTKYATPQTVNGLNLYAYCNNNPVMGYDPTGTFWDKIRDWFSTITGLRNPVSKFAAAVAVVGAIRQGKLNELAEDWNQGCFNPFNMNEKVALGAKVFSFYKGESVIIWYDKPYDGLQIFGTILLGDKIRTSDALNHEFGHGIQEKNIRASLSHSDSYTISNYILYTSR